MLPKSPVYTKVGHEFVEKEVDKLLPLKNITSVHGKYTRWDGKVGTVEELNAIAFQEIKQAAEEPEGGSWISLGPHHGVSREYHQDRTVAGGGNRFFRFRGILKVPPQLVICAMFEPSICGNLDRTVRHIRPIVDFPDGRSRLTYTLAEAGPRPLFLDRDSCTISTFIPPATSNNGTWWQISYEIPSHLSSIPGAVRTHTMYWGYKLEPFIDPESGNTFTRATLISQTKIFGWMPIFIVNQFIPTVLSDYMVHINDYLVEFSKRGAPARQLVESYGLSL